MAIHYPFITYCCLCLTLFYWKRLGFGSSYYRRPREAVFRSYPFFLQKYLAPLKICWIFQRPLKKLHSDLKLHIPLNLIQMVTLLKKWPTPELFNPVNQSNKQTNSQTNNLLDVQWWPWMDSNLCSFSVSFQRYYVMVALREKSGAMKNNYSSICLKITGDLSFL